MFRSIVFKNVLLFLAILVVAVGPLSWQYYRDSRDAEIQNLASKAIQILGNNTGIQWGLDTDAGRVILDRPAVNVLQVGPCQRRDGPAMARDNDVLAPCCLGDERREVPFQLVDRHGLHGQIVPYPGPIESMIRPDRADYGS